MRCRTILSLSITGLLLCGCSTYTQTTSGQDWLAAYRAAPARQGAAPDDIDTRVRLAGAIEPTLRFPARIGIARIGKSGWQPELAAVPADEVAAWMAARERLGAGFGEFIPVSPLVAAMMEPDIRVGPNDRVGAARHLIDTIRLAAARQHLDAVLIYEVNATADQKSNPLRFADWTVIGAFVLPSQDVKAMGVAQAMLVDVRNGYPYGQVTSSVDDKTMSAVFYSGEAKASLSQKVEDAAVVKLAGESEAMLRRLKDDLAARR
ncbi:MAG TPA: hypothetical protein VHZ32_04985 [Rhizomicrobium sp.]|nr:hypothetical protein [Rhizomicrobium sp.]